MLKVLSQFDCNVSDFFTFTLEIFFFDQTDFCIVGINPVVKLFGCQYDFLNMYTDRSPVFWSSGVCCNTPHSQWQ